MPSKKESVVILPGKSKLKIEVAEPSREENIANEASFHALTDPHREAAGGPPSPRDVHSPILVPTETSGTGSGQHSNASSDEDVEKGFIAKCLAKIPFTVLVALLMAIPVVFLVAYSIINFVDAAGTLQCVNRHTDLIRALETFENVLMDERTRTRFALIVDNTTESYDRLYNAREIVDNALDALLLLTQGTTGDEGRISKGYTTELRELAEHLALARHELDAGRVCVFEFRAMVAEYLLVIDEGRSLVAALPPMLKHVKSFLNLKFVRQIANNLRANRGAGQLLLDGGYGDEFEEVKDEFTSSRLLYYSFLKQLRPLEFGRGKQFLDFAESNPDFLLAVTMLEELAKDPARIHSFTGTDYYNSFKHALDQQKGIDKLFIDDIKSDATGDLVIECVKLILALVGCTFAGGLILRSNVETQRQMDRVVTKSKTMQNAVQKFVPRAFLKLCGCTSILHVSAGDETQVATTMLFSDIRNFTSVSEKMTNEQLFAWLQSYFRKMTGITEGNHGFIDRFNGDAIFSVFTSTRGAVQCGIEMLTAVGQLNIEFVSKRAHNLIEIGVGVHYAVVSAGFLGDENRLTVTLISPEVNTPQRLEMMSKKYGARILVSQQAVSQIGDLSDFDCRRLGEVVIRGSDKPFGIMDVYQADPLDVKNYKNESKSVFEEAVELRSKGKIEKSNVLFERCRTMASAVDLEDDAVNVKLSHAQARDEIDDI